MSSSLKDLWRWIGAAVTVDGGGVAASASANVVSAATDFTVNKVGEVDEVTSGFSTALDLSFMGDSFLMAISSFFIFLVVECGRISTNCWFCCFVCNNSFLILISFFTILSSILLHSAIVCSFTQAGSKVVISTLSNFCLFCLGSPSSKWAVVVSSAFNDNLMLDSVITSSSRGKWLSIFGISSSFNISNLTSFLISKLSVDRCNFVLLSFNNCGGMVIKSSSAAILSSSRSTSILTSSVPLVSSGSILTKLSSALIISLPGLGDLKISTSSSWSLNSGRALRVEVSFWPISTESSSYFTTVFIFICSSKSVNCSSFGGVVTSTSCSWSTSAFGYFRSSSNWLDFISSISSFCICLCSCIVSFISNSTSTSTSSEASRWCCVWFSITSLFWISFKESWFCFNGEHDSIVCCVFSHCCCSCDTNGSGDDGMLVPWISPQFCVNFSSVWSLPVNSKRRFFRGVVKPFGMWVGTVAGELAATVCCWEFTKILTAGTAVGDGVIEKLCWNSSWDSSLMAWRSHRFLTEELLLHVLTCKGKWKFLLLLSVVSNIEALDEPINDVFAVKSTPGAADISMYPPIWCWTWFCSYSKECFDGGGSVDGVGDPIDDASVCCINSSTFWAAILKFCGCSVFATVSVWDWDCLRSLMAAWSNESKPPDIPLAHGVCVSLFPDVPSSSVWCSQLFIICFLVFVGGGYLNSVLCISPLLSLLFKLLSNGPTAASISKQALLTCEVGVGDDGDDAVVVV